MPPSLPFRRSWGVLSQKRSLSLQSTNCYYFADWIVAHCNIGAAWLRTARGSHMLNSLDAGRRLALRVVVMQLGVAVAIGIVFLLQGLREAVAASAGALVVALGTALLSIRAFAGLGVGGIALGRLLSGMVLKWVATIGGLIVILVQFKLPPLAAITGLAAAYAVNLLAFRFKG